MNENVKWAIEDMIEVRLKEDDDFLKVKETLTNWDSFTQRKEVISILPYTPQTGKIL